MSGKIENIERNTEYGYHKKTCGGIADPSGTGAGSGQADR